jgi:hypothetical protein
VIGWDPAREAVLMHDPNGEALLIGGGYVSTAIGSGRKLRYSLANWGRRWMVEGLGSGLPGGWSWGGERWGLASRPMGLVGSAYCGAGLP